MYLNTKHEMFLIHLLEIHIALQQNTNNRIDLFIVKDLNRGSYRCIICNWDYFIENILETYRKILNRATIYIVRYASIVCFRYK